MSHLLIPSWSGLEPLNAGVFISRGRGTHPTRAIDSHELILVRRGILHIREDKQEFAVAAGETLLLHAGRQHGGSAPYGHDLEFVWLHFRLRRRCAGSLLHAIPQHVRPRRMDVLGELARRYLDDQSDGPIDGTRGGLLLTLMLIEIDAGTTPTARATTGEALAGRADMWMRTHYHQSISTVDVARALDCHPDHIGRTFASVRGVTVVDALISLRLAAARRLLLDGIQPIASIAHQCGFSDEAYFRRVFRRHHGSSPRVWRLTHARMYVNSD